MNIKINDEGKQVIFKNCIFCREEVQVETTDEQIQELQKGDKLIQDIFPNANPGDREVFISGMCNKCFLS